jgi:hypothetical protein
MPPVEKPLIVGRKAIMDFLQITNWDSVLKLVRQENLPVGKAGGRWCGRRVNILAWLDQRSNSGTLQETDQQRAISALERVEVLLARLTNKQRSVSRRVRWRQARKRRQLLGFI